MDLQDSAPAFDAPSDFYPAGRGCQRLLNTFSFPLNQKGKKIVLRNLHLWAKHFSRSRSVTTGYFSDAKEYLYCNLQNYNVKICGLVYQQLFSAIIQQIFSIKHLSHFAIKIRISLIKYTKSNVRKPTILTILTKSRKGKGRGDFYTGNPYNLNKSSGWGFGLRFFCLCFFFPKFL